MTKEQAANTAAGSLHEIERWARATFIAAAVAAGMLTIMTLMAGYVGLDYLRAKSAMAEASAKLQDFQKDMAKSFPTPRPATAFRPGGVR